MKTIRVPYDFSDLEDAALACATTLAPGLGARVRVLPALPSPTQYAEMETVHLGDSA